MNEENYYLNQFLYSHLSGKSANTIEVYKHDIYAFLNYTFGTIDVSIDELKQITPVDIESFLSAGDFAPRTKARHKSSLSSLFKYLTDIAELLDKNPMIKVKSIKIDTKEEITYLDMKDQDKLVQSIMYGTGLSKRQQILHKNYIERDLALIFLLLDTGMRLDEIQSLNIGNLIPDKCALKVKRKAHQEESTIYYSDQSLEYIKDYILTRTNVLPSSPLFLSRDGNRLSRREIQTLVKKYVSASLNRNDISVHKLRSSFAMEFYKHERDILVLQQKLGHRSIAATNIYAKAAQREERIINTRNWRN